MRRVLGSYGIDVISQYSAFLVKRLQGIEDFFVSKARSKQPRHQAETENGEDHQENQPQSGSNGAKDKYSVNNSKGKTQFRPLFDLQKKTGLELSKGMSMMSSVRS